MRFCPKFLRRTSGFSLIELSAVISIAAAVAVGTLSWSQPEKKTLAKNLRETQGKIREISEAIEVFRVKFNRLPCPADPYLRADNTRIADAPDEFSYTQSFGKENLDMDDSDPAATLGTDCPVNVGAIPVYDLELPESYMTDGWGRRFVYHVSDKLCGTDAGTDAAFGNLAEETSRKRGCSAYDYSSYSGDLVVSNAAGEKIITGAAYVLLSHGTNGYGAFLPSGARMSFPDSHTDVGEKENADNYAFTTPPTFDKSDKEYVMTDISEQNNTSDDILLARTKSQTETLTSDENRTMVSKQRCDEVAAIMESADLTALTEVARDSTELNSFTAKGGSNTGDTAILSVLDAIQRLCRHYHTAFNYKCPNGATLGAGDICECASGDWENC